MLTTAQKIAKEREKERRQILRDHHLGISNRLRQEAYWAKKLDPVYAASLKLAVEKSHNRAKERIE